MKSSRFYTFTVPNGKPNFSAISRYLNPDTCMEKVPYILLAMH